MNKPSFTACEPAKRRQHGNTLALVVVCVGLVIIFITWFVLNYTQLFGSREEAKTAVDAGALKGALDMSRIVVTHASDNTYFGNVALVDDVFEDSNNNPDYTKRPVLGINTIMATIRLDALIAGQANNTTMLVACMEDLLRAESDSKTLRNKIIQAAQGGKAYDKNGNLVTMLADVNAAYDANSVRLAEGARQGDAIITPGTLNAAGTSNVPTPTPNSLAQVTGSTYPSCTPVPTNVLNQSLNFTFTATANQVSLIDESLFLAVNPSDTTSYIAPSCVQVQVSQQVTGMAPVSSIPSATKENPNPSPTTSRPTTALTVISTAQAGGPILDFPTGSLVLYFAVPPPMGQNVDWTSVQSIMNNSQIPVSNATNTNPAVNMGGASPYMGWNNQSTGNWLQASGGGYPAVSSATLAAAPYRARSSDDPSVVLSFMVYDWLSHAYLRPDIQATVSGLSTALNVSTVASGKQPETAQGDFIAPVYAASQKLHPATFGYARVPLDGHGDPRDATQSASHPDGTRRMIANVFGYVPAAQTLPDTMLLTTIQNGTAQTTNGQPASVLIDFWNAIHQTNQTAAQTLKAAQAVFKQEIQQITTSQQTLAALKQKDGSAAVFTADPQAQSQMSTLNAAFLQAKRARTVMANATFIINSALAMLNDRKTISALGVTEVATNNFQIVNGNFYPTTQAATTQALLGGGSIPTGQAAGAPNPDWSTPLMKGGTSQLAIFSSSATPVSSNGFERATFLQPALAVTSTTPNQWIELTVSGDSTTGSGGQGAVNEAVLTSTPYGANVQDQQFAFQNTAGWVSTDNSTGQQMAWQVIARDNAAVDYGGYYADTNDGGYNGADSNGIALISEWTLRCPVPCPGQTCCTATQTINVHSGAWLAGAVNSNSASNSNTDLGNVNPQVDSSGNITYWYSPPGQQPQQMFFFQAAATKTQNEKNWAANVLLANKTSGATADIGETNGAAYNYLGVYAGIRGQTYVGAGSGPAWSAVFYDDPAAANYGITPGNLKDYYNSGSGPMSSITAGQSLSAAQIDAARWSVYSNVVFYTTDDHNCSQLYVWSS